MKNFSQLCHLWQSKLMVILMVFCLFHVQVNGQIEPRKKVITPATNSKVIKNVPNQVIPVNPASGEAITIMLTAPAMTQRDVPLNTLFTWSATPATGLTYDVYLAKQRDDDAAGNHRFEKVSQNQTATSFQPALSNGEVYHWKVVAKRSDGSLAESATYFFFTPNAAPTAAVLTLPANGAVQVPVTPTFSWQPTIDPEMKEVKYSVWLAIDPGQYTNSNFFTVSSASFTATTPLRHGETYYWKVTSTDDAGKSTESEEFKFTVDPVNWEEPITTGSFTDPRDNKSYRTVTIGQQVWMAENLAWLPAVNNTVSTLSDPLYKVYNYMRTDVAAAKNTENYRVYGVLYNWGAAQQACPAGWHLPADSDWNQLLEYLGMNSSELASDNNYYSDIIVDKMCETGSAHWLYAPSTVNNASLFSALPAGFVSNNVFYQRGSSTSFWTSTSDITEGITAWEINYPLNENGNIRRKLTSISSDCFSVRCVKD